MASAVRMSSMALRLLWILNVALGVYIAYIATSSEGWVLIHMFSGIVIIVIFWFLGIAQALVKGGSLTLTVATFAVGLTLAVIGMSQPAVTNLTALRLLQGAHVIFMLAVIALAEMCAARYRKGLPAAQAG